MSEAAGAFVLGLLLLALGGDSAVKGASGLAQRAGLSPFAAGLLLVALATSLPELAVNLHAILRGADALALGNAVGSNVANVGLTLGLAALVAPVLVRWRALSPLLAVLVVGTLAVVALAWDGALAAWEGVLLLVAYVAVVVFAMRRTGDEAPEVRAEIEAYARTSTSRGLNAIRLAIAAALLYFGARFVVDGATTLGPALGLSTVLTGLLPVAIGTALPEAAAAIVAARRGQGDLVAGHVIGSSLFNLLVIVGGMAAFGGLAVPPSLVRFELPAALAFALLLYPLLRGDMTVSRREGGVLLAALVAWIAFELVLLHA